ncbi:MAG: hypothetical protein KUL86_10845 [Castellaniella sp.]|nr:hypothetical protein [Castellaniella sp.]
MIPQEITQIATLFQAIQNIAEQHDDEHRSIIAGLASTGHDLASYFGNVLDGDNSDPGPRASAHGMPQAVLNEGYEAAQKWYADMVERMEALCRQESRRQGREIIAGYCVNSWLKEAFNDLPAGQHGAFLDAVGAYLVTHLAYGEPTKEFRATSDLLAMYASTPAEQDAWSDRHNDEEVAA